MLIISDKWLKCYIPKWKRIDTYQYMKCFVKFFRNIYICINTGTQARGCISQRIKIKNDMLGQTVNWVPGPGNYLNSMTMRLQNSLIPQMRSLVSKDIFSVIVSKSHKFQEFELIWSFGSKLLHSYSFLFLINLLRSVVTAQFSSLFDFFFFNFSFGGWNSVYSQLIFNLPLRSSMPPRLICHSLPFRPSNLSILLLYICLDDFLTPWFQPLLSFGILPLETPSPGDGSYLQNYTNTSSVIDVPPTGAPSKKVFSV